MDADSPFVWHYTVGTPLAAIARSGRLVPGAGGTCEHTAEVCHGILWFSRNQQWDPSASKDDKLRADARGLTRAALHARFGLYRFGLRADDRRLLPWPTVTRVADIDVPDAMTMVASGLRCGAAPTDWIGSLTDVPVDELVFEAWNGRGWIAADLHELAAQLA
ncbi:hypothetical protein [Cupriavidus pampae]|uniref:DUF4433 domain-containing protein n=1 Tax=Cupriavidus pampae TaxID=659251 RepID=A0ABN7YDM6_9BURK|nr:hypothetical protein [Cupriavidus pampae]CAG9171553.1 hypothetical protein LMG32289_02420 [Cupriavidus pampae]